MDLEVRCEVSKSSHCDSALGTYRKETSCEMFGCKEVLSDALGRGLRPGGKDDARRDSVGAARQRAPILRKSMTEKVIIDFARVLFGAISFGSLEIESYSCGISSPPISVRACVCA